MRAGHLHNEDFSPSLWEGAGGRVERATEIRQETCIVVY